MCLETDEVGLVCGNCGQAYSIGAGRMKYDTKTGSNERFGGAIRKNDGEKERL